MSTKDINLLAAVAALAFLIYATFNTLAGAINTLQAGSIEARSSILSTSGILILSLYIQARNILAENIGWEPEIQNINGLIADLETEKANYLERKRLEEQARIAQQEEFEIFQDEINKRRDVIEAQKQEQRAQYRAFEVQKARAAQR